VLFYIRLYLYLFACAPPSTSFGSKLSIQFKTLMSPVRSLGGIYNNNISKEIAIIYFSRPRDQVPQDLASTTAGVTGVPIAITSSLHSTEPTTAVQFLVGVHISITILGARLFLDRHLSISVPAALYRIACSPSPPIVVSKWSSSRGGSLSPRKFFFYFLFIFTKRNSVTVFAPKKKN
jgi:hypothetical protein